MLLSLHEINAEIKRLLGDVPLKAHEDNGRIYLADGETNPAEVDDRSLTGVAELLYDWAVFVGETSETFEDFLESRMLCLEE